MIELPDAIRGWPIHQITVYMYILVNSRDDELQYTRDGLARELGLTPQKLRTILTRLEVEGYAKNFTSKQGSKVALTNINQRLTNTHPDTQQVTTYINQHQPTINQRESSSPPSSSPTSLITSTTLPTNNPSKERPTNVGTKKASLQDRVNAFYNSLVPYVEEYGAEMVRAFFDYWTEPNKSGTKFRKEMQPTWDTARRLRTWEAREAKPMGRQKDIGVIIDNTEDQDYQPWG